MKVREFFKESKQNLTVGICFGRFNPTHVGHVQLWECASQCNYWYIGTNSTTTGASDPLPFDAKVAVMESVFPKIKGHVVSEKNLLTMAADVYRKLGENIELKVFTDETWPWAKLTQYNGVKKDHGYYKFQSITHAPTSRISSATTVREAVETSDRQKFKESSGFDPNTVITYQGKQYPYFEFVSKFTKSTANEEAAGVGIITKQNSTKDVKPGTLKKNLKAFNLVKEMENLEQEFDTLAEASKKRTPMRKNNTESMPSMSVYDVLDNNNHPYMAYRFGVALAGSPETACNPSGPLGSAFSMIDFSEGDAEIRKGAEKAIGVKSSRNTGKGSKELDSVHKVSPVAKPKRNQHGV